MTNNDYIEIKEEVYRDMFPIVQEFPITNTEEWERWVERFNYRSHLIALVPNPKNDPWGRPMLPYKLPYDDDGWPAPPSDDMDRDNCMTLTSVGGQVVKLYRRTSDWVDPFRRARKQNDTAFT